MAQRDYEQEQLEQLSIHLRNYGGNGTNILGRLIAVIEALRKRIAALEQPQKGRK